MAKDASGVVLVTDADQMNIKDLESWFVLSTYIPLFYFFMKWLQHTVAALNSFLYFAYTT